MTPDLLAHALHYAAAGLPVFPLGDGGTPEAKRPRLQWREAATTDRSVIRDWWTLWPRANIGMPTGSASGVYVVDVDGQEGWDWLSMWGRKNNTGLLGEEVTTGRPAGVGAHLYFSWQEGLRNSAGKIAPGIDERGEGGYVVLPPSRHDQEPFREYNWVGRPKMFAPTDLQPPPQAWLDLVAAVHRPPPPQLPPAATRTPERSYLRAALEQAAERVRTASAPTATSGGSRNHTLNEEAFNLGQLEAHGLSQGEAQGALLQAAVAAGLGISEATKTFSSGWGAGRQHPRQLAERPTYSVTGRYEASVETKLADPVWAEKYEWALGELVTHSEGGEVKPQETGWVEDLEDKRFEPNDWLVEGMILRGAVFMIAAAPKVAKTWVGLEILSSLVTGEHVFGEFKTKRPERPVYAFLAEDTERSARNRIASIYRAKGHKLKDHPRRFAYSSMNYLDLSSIESSAGCVADILVRCPDGVSTVYFDPLRNLHTKQENDSEEMHPVMIRLKRITQILDCTVILSHHLKKDGRSGADIRGSESIRGSLDGYMVLVEDKGRAGPQLLASTVSETKTKGARSAEGYDIALEIEDSEGGEATSAKWSYERKGEAPGAKSLRSMTERAIEQVGAGGCAFTMSELLEHGELSRPTVLRHLAELTKEGRLEVGRRGKSHTWRWAG